MTSLGQQLTSMTGAVGLVTNVGNIFLANWAGTSSSTTTTSKTGSTGTSATTPSSNSQKSLDFSAFNNALATHNAYNVGAFIGTLIFKTLATEIPTYASQTKNPFPY